MGNHNAGTGRYFVPQNIERRGKRASAPKTD
jgi:hypothetical protein